MSPTVSTPSPITVRPEGDHLVLSTPWESAEMWQSRLREAGFPSTIHWDAAAHETQLELWPGADPDELRAAVVSLENA